MDGTESTSAVAAASNATAVASAAAQPANAGAAANVAADPAASAAKATATPADATATAAAAAATAAAAEAAKAAAADPAKVAAEAAAKVAADKVIADANAKIAADARAELSKSMVKTVNDLRAGWLTASKADPEFGGENYEANLGLAREAMKAYASPAFNKFLDETGQGNHPEVIRHFLKLGKDVAEGKLVIGRQAAASAEGKSQAQRLYPNNP